MHAPTSYNSRSCEYTANSVQTYSPPLSLLLIHPSLCTPTYAHTLTYPTLITHILTYPLAPTTHLTPALRTCTAYTYLYVHTTTLHAHHAHHSCSCALYFRSSCSDLSSVWTSLTHLRTHTQANRLCSERTVDCFQLRDNPRETSERAC